MLLGQHRYLTTHILYLIYPPAPCITIHFNRKSFAKKIHYYHQHYRHQLDASNSNRNVTRYECESWVFTTIDTLIDGGMSKHKTSKIVRHGFETELQAVIGCIKSFRILLLDLHDLICILLPEVGEPLGVQHKRVYRAGRRLGAQSTKVDTFCGSSS